MVYPNKRRKPKMHKGGEIIGQGSFGKVIRPGVICDTSNFVSKVFTGRNALESQKTEILFLNKMKNIDPEENFTINNFQSCNVSSDIPELSDIKNENKHSSYPQVVFRYGGKDLYSIIKNNTIKFPLESIIQLILNFMIEFKNFQNKRIVHNDIKTLNMLYDDNKFYLIDYSLTTNYDDILKKDNLQLLDYIYPTYPPEFHLMSDIYKRCNDIECILSILQSKKNLLIANMFLNISKDPIESTLYRVNPNSYIGGATEYIDLMIKYISENKNNLSSLDIDKIIYVLFGSNIDKIDIYALGVVWNTFLIFKCDMTKDFDKSIYDELQQLFFNMKKISPINRCNLTQIITKLKKLKSHYVSNMQVQSAGNSNNNNSKKNNSKKKNEIETNPFMSEIMQKLLTQEDIKSPEISQNVRLKQMNNIIEKNI